MTYVFGAAIVLGTSVLTAWVLRPEPVLGPCAVASGPVTLPDVPETSGLATGRRARDILWSHNSSGNDAVLLAMDLAGAVRGRVAVPMRMRDWEDVSAGRCPAGDCLYLADIGDNGTRRPHVAILRVPEPALPLDCARGKRARPRRTCASTSRTSRNCRARAWRSTVTCCTCRAKATPGVRRAA
jgi:hypothetical protein